MARLACVILLATIWATSAARAQDFSVHTKIYDARDKGKSSKPIGWSKTLFHAGKVYDCLDSVSWTTIFEPAQERFVLIDSARRISATISLGDLDNLLYQEEKRLEEQLAKRRSESDRWDVKLADFQLHPQFQNDFDAGRSSLVLTSPIMNYSVKCDKSDPVDLGMAYLEYTDWAAKLNYIAIPRAPFPGPRLQLNELLRRRQLLPVEVALKLNRTDGTNLVAKHQFSWKLDQHDRDGIREWEKLLHDPNIKSVPLTKLLYPAPASARGASGRGDKTVSSRRP